MRANVEKKEDSVIISRSEYEALLNLQKIPSVARPTIEERQIIQRGDREVKEGRFIPWHALKHAMASRRN